MPSTAAIKGTLLRGQSDYTQKLETAKLVGLDWNQTAKPRDRSKVNERAMTKLELLVRTSPVTVVILSGSVAGRKPKKFADSTGVAVYGEVGATAYLPAYQRSLVLATKQQQELLDSIAPNLEKFMQQFHSGYQRKEREVVLTFKKPDGEELDRFIASVTSYLNSALREAASSITITKSTDSVDITPTGLDKGRVIEAIAGRRGIDLGDVICIGNGHNDLPGFRVVFEAGGIVIMPSNAEREVVGIMSRMDGPGTVILSNLPSTDCVVDVFWAIHRGNDPAYLELRQAARTNIL